MTDRCVYFLKTSFDFPVFLVFMSIRCCIIVLLFLDISSLDHRNLVRNMRAFVAFAFA